MELATRFNGEIINGDAMQMYDGLPIITNKITTDERKGIPHHLLGFISLDEEPWQVGLFKQRASQIIREIRSRGRLPILVGGTHYYTQSFLFQDSLVTNGEEQVQTQLSNQEIAERYPILDGPTNTMIERLREVDPIMADRWHPNDRRKIRRSLEIFLLTGKRASDIYAAQNESKNSVKASESSSDEEGTISAYDNLSTLFFWVHADSEILKGRLNKRVDTMMDAGMLDELKTMNSFLRHQDLGKKDIDRSRGIWASIGWKEFESYLVALETGNESHEQLQGQLDLSTEQMKAATRQYAKRQIRWIRLKLIPALSNQNQLGKLYLLDGTDIARWSDDVVNPAMDVTANFLAGEKLRAPRELSDAANDFLTPERSFEFARRRDLWVRQECDLCHTVCVTEDQWQNHLKSRGHRRMIKKQTGDARSGRSPIQTRRIGPCEKTLHEGHSTLLNKKALP